MIDLQAERQSLTLDEITLLQGLKTGALIAFACDAGAILGRAQDTERAALADYARDLGLAFQIKDDLLTGRATVPSPARMPGATRMSARPRSSASWASTGRWRSWPCCRRDASARLDIFGARSKVLKQALAFVIERQ